MRQQIEWREALEDGNVTAARDEVSAAYDGALKLLREACEQQNWPDVQIVIAQCQFIENFLRQLPQVI